MQIALTIVVALLNIGAAALTGYAAWVAIRHRGMNGNGAH